MGEMYQAWQWAGQSSRRMANGECSYLFELVRKLLETGWDGSDASKGGPVGGGALSGPRYQAGGHTLCTPALLLLVPILAVDLDGAIRIQVLGRTDALAIDALATLGAEAVLAAIAKAVDPAAARAPG